MNCVNKKGFTLIELLVVIAMIGVLSAVVLSALGNARSKGVDVKTVAQFSNIRKATEIYYLNNKTYGPLNQQGCNTNMYADTVSGIAQLVTITNYPTGSFMTCNATADAWAVEVRNGPPGAKFYCVDSTGLSTVGMTQKLIDGNVLTCN